MVSVVPVAPDAEISFWNKDCPNTNCHVAQAGIPRLGARAASTDSSPSALTRPQPAAWPRHPTGCLYANDPAHQEPQQLRHLGTQPHVLGSCARLAMQTYTRASGHDYRRRRTSPSRQRQLHGPPRERAVASPQMIQSAEQPFCLALPSVPAWRTSPNRRCAASTKHRLWPASNCRMSGRAPVTRAYLIRGPRELLPMCPAAPRQSEQFGEMEL
jgi:hypothetical protein